MKKVLVTGGSGLLGQYINLAAAENFGIFTIFRNNSGNCMKFPASRIDIRSKKDLEIIFNDFRPDAVIHCAAITNPQIRADQTAKDYYDTNVTAAKNIAELCTKFGSKLVYISTDLVYAGYRGSFLKEDSKLIPATLYAETKLMGEVKIKESTDKFVILRTALLYGMGLNHSRCHFHNMFYDLKNKKPVRLFTDQYRTPISLTDAASIIVNLTGLDVKGEIINVAGSERVSRFELGEILCSSAGFDKNFIQKIRMEDIPGFPKVEDVSLNTDKLQSLGFKPKSIEENIFEIIRHNQ